MTPDQLRRLAELIRSRWREPNELMQIQAYISHQTMHELANTLEQLAEETTTNDGLTVTIRIPDPQPETISTLFGNWANERYPTPKDHT